MPIKIGTGSSAVDLSNLKVAGVEPSRIMVGTGSGAVEVWPSRYTATVTGPNTTPTRDEWVPVVSHTVTSLGVSLISGSVNWVNRLSASTYQVQIVVNGSVIATNTVHTQNVQSVSVGSDRTVNPGDVVVLEARSDGSSLSDRRRLESPTLTFV